jgi:hypothetical protein
MLVDTKSAMLAFRDGFAGIEAGVRMRNDEERSECGKS